MHSFIYSVPENLLYIENYTIVGGKVINDIVSALEGLKTQVWKTNRQLYVISTIRRVGRGSYGNTDKWWWTHQGMKVRERILKTFHSFIKQLFIKPPAVLDSGDTKVSESDLVLLPSGEKLAKWGSERINKGSALRSLDFILRKKWNH